MFQTRLRQPARKRVKSRSTIYPICWLAATILLGAANPASGQSHHDWSYDLGIYEVNVRQYSQEGTFAAVESHLDRLQDLGTGILWLMPIHPIGIQNRLGSLGSYYSVRDYRAINPEFGSMEDFKQLVQAAHDRGMYVIIDWVANHTSWDNPLTVQHPEWYVTNSNGSFIPPPGTNWSDVIELDYSEQGLRDYMIESMKFWVQETGIDGFRCDAVSFVPTDFWAEAISALKAVRPDLFFLAEGDGVEWHNAGFDMTYGWGLYGFESGVLKRIADGTNSASNLSAYAATEKAIYPAPAYRMYFTSNHDENSWHGTTRELFGEAADAFAVLTATFNGMPLIYSGQEAGLNKRLKFFDKDLISWQDHPNTALYRTLLTLKRDHRSLWNGEAGGRLQRILSDNNSAAYMFVREKDDDRVLAVINVSGSTVTISPSMGSYAGTYKDVFSGESVEISETMTIELPAWGYRVYTWDPTGTRSESQIPESAATTLEVYPNPFNDQATVTFSVPTPTELRLSIFDMTGREVERLTDGLRAAGLHTVVINGAALPAGPYLIRLEAGDVVHHTMLSLLR